MMSDAVGALLLLGPATPRQPALHFRIIGVASLLQLLVVRLAQDSKRLQIAIGQLGDRIEVASGQLSNGADRIAALSLGTASCENRIENLFADVVLEADECAFAARTRANVLALLAGCGFTEIEN